MLNKDNVRVFTFNLHLTDGRVIEIKRECDRPIPPTKDWVLQDQHQLMTAPYNNGWAHFQASNGNIVRVQTIHIIDIELVHVKEGMDIDALKERYNIK